MPKVSLSSSNQILSSTTNSTSILGHLALNIHHLLDWASPSVLPMYLAGNRTHIPSHSKPAGMAFSNTLGASDSGAWQKNVLFPGQCAWLNSSQPQWLFAHALLLHVLHSNSRRTRENNIVPVWMELIWQTPTKSLLSPGFLPGYRFDIDWENHSVEADFPLAFKSCPYILTVLNGLFLCFCPRKMRLKNVPLNFQTQCQMEKTSNLQNLYTGDDRTQWNQRESWKFSEKFEKGA